MLALVTGGAGFIGANLCRDLRLRGVHVRVLDDLSSGSHENVDGLDIEFRLGSVLDEAALDAAVQGVDAVVHLAAQVSVPVSIGDPIGTHRVNVDGTIATLEAARRHGVGQVVFASSSAVYGAHPASPTHENLPTVPVSPYGVSKLAAEAYALAYQSSYGLPVLAFRFFNVFGRLQAAGHAYAAVIPAFLAKALDGLPVHIDGDGLQTRDFTHVDAVTSVITAAVVRRVAHPAPVNLAFGTTTSLLELLDLIEAELGRAVPRKHGAPRAGDIRHSRADASLLRRMFPEVEPTPLWESLADTMAWYRSLPEVVRAG